MFMESIQPGREDIGMIGKIRPIGEGETHLLASPEDSAGKIGLHRLSQEVLCPAPAKEIGDRHLQAQFDQPVVQQGETVFDGDGHGEMIATTHVEGDQGNPEMVKRLFVEGEAIIRFPVLLHGS